MNQYLLYILGESVFLIRSINVYGGRHVNIIIYIKFKILNWN